LDWQSPLIGGVLIGSAASLMLVLNGRVTGISGIIYGALSPTKGDLLWRVLFLLGLVFGGYTLNLISAKSFENTLNSELITIVIAGLLVGFGTVMGSGCTSGHGVCGLSRLSVRSIVATLSFMSAGLLTVFLFKKLGVLP
jgi:uncharacterized membrane protein YedE/YeeE